MSILQFVGDAWWPPFLLGLVILGLAYWSFQRFSRRIDRLKSAVQSAVAGLSSLESPNQLTEEYEELSARLSADRILGSTWEEFQATLILPTDDGLVLNTRRPSDYFNDNLYYSGEINLRAFESVPNQLVGIGLLLTFTGLVVALLIARQGLRADMAVAQKSLGELLYAASFKFVTSISALGGSVTYQFFQNRLLHQVDELIGRFCNELERLTAQITAESVADRSHRELVTQTSQLERFNSELAVSIAEALDGKLRDSMSLAMQPIADEIGTLSQRMAEINQGALEQMVDRFSSNLGGAARKHTDQLAGVLRAAAESIAQVPEHIDEAGERFRQQIKVGTAELSASMTAAAENMDAVLQQSVRGLRDSVDISTAKFLDIASVLDRTRQVLENAATIGEKLAEAAGAAEGLAAVGAGVASAAAGLELATEKVSELTGHVSTLNVEAATVVEKLAERVGRLERELTNLTDAMGKAFDKLSGGVGEFGQKTTSFVKDLDKTLAEALSRLSGAVQQMDEILDQLPKKTDFNDLARAIRTSRPVAEAAE